MGLVLKDISRQFGAVAAVESASLAAASGEIVSLFGPSGCGKTTLLRAAAGLERPDGGEVELDGVLLSGAGHFTAPEKREIGFVFQDYVLFPHLTALENVAFGLKALPAAERARRSAAELASCGLEALDDRYPHQLSGGQQQRVALARALARRPKAMLLDEPFAAIDAAMRARLRLGVRRILKTSGAAAILVTHDADEALALGDRVAIMKEGRIIEIARPADLFERPQTPEGAALFAGSQRFRARVAGRCIDTPLGVLNAERMPDGPCEVVLLPGAVTLVEDEGGGLEVIDCRFLGPGWRVEATGAGLESRGASEVPIELGKNVRAIVDAARIRVFPS
ncbi:MAG: ABC transporter ATP-binding protein [Parvularculaceae bacterium]